MGAARNERTDFRELANGRLAESVEIIKKTILSELENVYQEELKDSYKPTLFDKHQYRHYEKLKIAKSLRSLCQSKTDSVLDIQKFISQYELLAVAHDRLNNVGRLGRFLSEYNKKYVKDLKKYIFDDFIPSSLNIINELKCKIKMLKHLRAIAKEKKIDAEFLAIKGKTSVYPFGLDSTKYHIEEVIKLISALVAEQKKDKAYQEALEKEFNLSIFEDKSNEEAIVEIENKIKNCHNLAILEQAFIFDWMQKKHKLYNEDYLKFKNNQIKKIILINDFLEELRFVEQEFFYGSAIRAAGDTDSVYRGNYKKSFTEDTHDFFEYKSMVDDLKSFIYNAYDEINSGEVIETLLRGMDCIKEKIKKKKEESRAFRPTYSFVEKDEFFSDSNLLACYLNEFITKIKCIFDKIEKEFKIFNPQYDELDQRPSGRGSP